MPIGIGVDIGGSHISCAAVNMETHKIIPDTYFQNEVNSKANKEEILRVWGNTINKSINNIKEADMAGVGFAMPGPFRYKEGIAMFEINDKYEALYNVSVVSALPPYLSQQDLQLRFLNDASSFGLGSMLTGGVTTDKKVVAVTLGTGFGAAFFDGGRPVIVGDNVPENGCLWDKKFKEGISDDYFSTRWFVNEYENQHGRNINNGVKGILDENKEKAKSVFQKFTQNFCQFMTPYIRMFQPDVLIIGGSIAKSSDLFLPDLKQQLEEATKPLSIQIITNTEEANIVGACYALNDVFWNKIKDELPKI